MTFIHISAVCGFNMFSTAHDFHCCFSSLLCLKGNLWPTAFSDFFKSLTFIRISPVCCFYAGFSISIYLSGFPQSIAFFGVKYTAFIRYFPDNGVYPDFPSHLGCLPRKSFLPGRSRMCAVFPWSLFIGERWLAVDRSALSALWNHISPSSIWRLSVVYLWILVLYHDVSSCIRPLSDVYLSQITTLPER